MLGAYSVKGTELITVTNDAYINSDTLVDLLTAIKRLHPDTAITLVMDNARYQRCDKVMDKAKELGIDLLFLPPYSPNLNLIERLWKFTKKQCLYNRSRLRCNAFQIHWRKRAGYSVSKYLLGRLPNTASEDFRCRISNKIIGAYF